MAVNSASTLPDVFSQAKISHQFYHQNAPALVRMFKLTRKQARAIVNSCPSCQSFALPSVWTGINPQGLESLELWQSDIK
ncbi:PO113 protein, partial [Phainopepla nitens]|nr:PO113 protein [Phainopepla nitens]